MEKFGLNTKEGNKGNNPSNKYGTSQCEPCENENFAKSFFLKSLPTRPVNLIALPLKITMLVYLTIKETKKIVNLIGHLCFKVVLNTGEI